MGLRRSGLFCFGCGVLSRKNLFQDLAVPLALLRLGLDLSLIPLTVAVSLAFAQTQRNKRVASTLQGGPRNRMSLLEPKRWSKVHGVSTRS